MQFHNCTLSDVMKNYPDDDGFAIAGRVALFFTLIFSYPVLMNPCREAINSLCLLLLRNCTRSRFFAVREEKVPETTNAIHVCVCVSVCVCVVCILRVWCTYVCSVYFTISNTQLLHIYHPDG